MEAIKELKKKLTKKLNEEYKEYISELKELSIDEVIEKSYETTMKKQFLSLLGEEKNIDRNELRALLDTNNTLDELYEQWDIDINNFDEVIDDTFIYSLNEIVEGYEESVQFDLENDENYELIQMIIDVLEEAGKYDFTKKFMNRYDISSIDTLLIADILKEKEEINYLRDLMIYLNDSETIQYYCEIKVFDNKCYDNIHKKILPELKEIYKELDKNKSKKNKGNER